jgi:hypothetical protein
MIVGTRFIGYKRLADGFAALVNQRGSGCAAGRAADTGRKRHLPVCSITAFAAGAVATSCPYKSAHIVASLQIKGNRTQAVTGTAAIKNGMVLVLGKHGGKIKRWKLVQRKFSFKVGIFYTQKQFAAVVPRPFRLYP